MASKQSLWQQRRDKIAEARASGETETELGRTLARWKNHDIIVQRDSKWLLDGLIMTFKREREISHAIDPSISPDLPAHLLDPVQIAYWFNLPLEEVD